MENLFSRYRNISILTGVLFLQILGLAVQVRRVKENQSTMLIRVWTVTAISPLEKGIVGAGNGIGSVWHNYLYLRGIRQENRALREEIQQLRLNEVRMSEDAQQAHRLQLLLSFKEQYLSQTLAAQVIGTGGTDQSRVIYIDKGNEDGDIKPEMPVITADGIVGKVVRVFAHTSQILLINDQTSGAGAVLEKSRLQGILRGTPNGGVALEKVMSDETVQPGDRVLTSGGDGIFPKGMPVGTVASVSQGKDSFLNIRIKPAANLNKLEEVLVITKQEEKVPSQAEAGQERASDILARRLPSVPDQPAPGTTPAGTQSAPKPAGTMTGNAMTAAAGAAKPATTATTKPATLVQGTAPKKSPNTIPVAAQSGNSVKTITDDPVPSENTVKKPESQPAQSAPAQTEDNQQ
jgi:rod shape-determining protein MreC